MGIGLSISKMWSFPCLCMRFQESKREAKLLKTLFNVNEMRGRFEHQTISKGKWFESSVILVKTLFLQWSSSCSGYSEQEEGNHHHHDDEQEEDNLHTDLDLFLLLLYQYQHHSISMILDSLMLCFTLLTLTRRQFQAIMKHQFCAFLTPVDSFTFSYVTMLLTLSSHDIKSFL